MTFDGIVTASADDHMRATDALLRFAAGVDRGDEGLLASAFADDAVVDFRPCGRKLGLDFPVISGREAIADFLAATGRSQVTSHVVSNARVHAEGAGAKLRALVDATHILKRDPSRRFRMMNWYDLDLVESGRVWHTTRLVIDNVWFDGEANILMDRG